MHITIRVLASHRQPLIKFIGKRSWPSKLAHDAPHAHPAAPPEFQKRHYDDVASSKPSSPERKSNSGGAALEFWQVPERFWKPRGRELEEREINAVLSGGASMR
ncbi:hypothetical protein R3P38DRAFT_871867 [Favolaschia claudopus]|uniref:Uncharacterized protein n=1 Tax=Favolaschia claudopus TaxID=2862362 RepID=A0AAW0BW57_9AGAR